MIGMPIVALATTEMALLIRAPKRHGRYAAGRADRCDAHADPRSRSRARVGRRRARDACERFGIERFVRDWDAALHDVAT